MAESTLSLTCTQLRNAMSFEAGYGGTAAITGTKSDKIDELLESGLRQFYFPPPIAGAQHVWSFLRPTTTIVAFTDTSGTMAVSGVPNTTITDNANTPFYPAMIGQTIVSTNDSYVIIAYTSSAIVTVDSDASADDTKDFTITTDGNYQLPDSFGNLIGKFTYDTQTMYPPIPVGAEGDIRQRRQLQPDRSSRPFLSAIRPKACDGTAGQRFELMLWPIPDDDYTLHYRYTVLPDALVRTTNPYALGGMAHAETIRESCLAIVEESLHGAKGVHCGKFLERLAASIAYDRKLGPQYLGANRDDSVRAMDRHNMPGVLVTYTP